MRVSTLCSHPAYPHVHLMVYQIRMRKETFKKSHNLKTIGVCKLKPVNELNNAPLEDQ